MHTHVIVKTCCLMGSQVLSLMGESGAQFDGESGAQFDGVIFVFFIKTEAQGIPSWKN